MNDRKTKERERAKRDLLHFPNHQIAPFLLLTSVLHKIAAPPNFLKLNLLKRSHCQLVDFFGCEDFPFDNNIGFSVFMIQL